MTRGRHRNHITLSGRATKQRTDEIEVEGTDAVMIDDLAARGLITAPQHRAGLSLLKDHSRGRSTFVLSHLTSARAEHARSMIINGTALVDYGRQIMGYKVAVTAEAWALTRLRNALDELVDIYHGHKGFAGYGSVEMLDADKGDE